MGELCEQAKSEMGYSISMLEQLIENATELLSLMQGDETADELEEANKLVAGISRDVAFVDGRVTAALQAQRDNEEEDEACEHCGAERCGVCGTCPNRCHDGTTITMRCCGY